MFSWRWNLNDTGLDLALSSRVDETVYMNFYSEKEEVMTHGEMVSKIVFLKRNWTNREIDHFKKTYFTDPKQCTLHSRIRSILHTVEVTIMESHDFIPVYQSYLCLMLPSSFSTDGNKLFRIFLISSLSLDVAAFCSTSI